MAPNSKGTMKMICKNLILFFISGVLLTSFTANSWANKPISKHKIKQIIIQESNNTRVPASLALAVAKVESNFNAKALSNAGARGIMQVMPKTGRGEFGINPTELWNPRINIRIGISYLEQLQKRYGGRWDLALSHYNGGTIQRAKSGQIQQPHSYTRNYINLVKKWEKHYRQEAVSNIALIKDKTKPFENIRRNKPTIFLSDKKELKLALHKSLKVFKKMKLRKLASNNYPSIIDKKSNKMMAFNSQQINVKQNQHGKFELDFFSRMRKRKLSLDDFR